MSRKEKASGRSKRISIWKTYCKPSLFMLNLLGQWNRGFEWLPDIENVPAGRGNQVKILNELVTVREEPGPTDVIAVLPWEDGIQVKILRVRKPAQIRQKRTPVTVVFCLFKKDTFRLPFSKNMADGAFRSARSNDAYELLCCKAAPAILETFEIRWFTT